jgi:cellulose synthase (UDP-forming)
VIPRTVARSEPPTEPAPPRAAELVERARYAGAAPWGLVPPLLGWLVGDDLTRRAAVKTRLVQVLIVLNVLLGTQYIVWRAWDSVNWALWPLGLSLLAAEMFSWSDSLLFGMNMWRVRQREAPPAPLPGLTVDVFVTTYNEPIELVLATARAAKAITYPHRTFVLDDGGRAELRAACEAIGVDYFVRSAAWSGKNRHAKAGNVINAMYQTAGEFMLILDADQVPRPEILDHVLGYFQDEKVAFVQTPQWFSNTPEGDPFGTDAPLFYGPIQAGKDGWNSAFFCGSNAVLRREALMLLGVVWYARELDGRVRSTLRGAHRVLRRARRRMREHPQAVQAIDEVIVLVRAARRALRAGEPLQSVTWIFQQGVERVSQRMVGDDLGAIRAELDAMTIAGGAEVEVSPKDFVRGLSTRDLSPIGAIAAVKRLLVLLDLGRADEAEPVLPLSTISVTEDMATAMRLHGLGWKSVYHHEVLAVGLAPEDLHTTLQQRLRWAQGTLQVLLRENPLWQPGLSTAQRLLYFGTMWSYLSGFASVIYLVCPILYLAFGLTPVRAFSLEFFGHLLPWLVVNQLLFALIGWGLPTWRGQQYSLALFPLWLKAVWTTVGNVVFGQPLGFVVTSKTRQGGVHLRLVWPQLLAIGLLVGAMVAGVARLALGWSDEPGPILVNGLWAAYDVALLSVVVVAARYRPAEPDPT